MHATRRQFVRLAAGIAFCTQFPLRGIAQNHGSAVDRAAETEDALSGVTAETFAAWIGSQFRVTLNRQPAGTVTLLSVTTLEPKPGASSAVRAVTSPAITSFALRFSKTGAPLTQETYTLEHDWLGTFPLLLVPSGTHATPATCTAVFSLLQ